MFQWSKHPKGATSALDSLTGARVAGLAPGEALVRSWRATDPPYIQRPVKLAVRPRFAWRGPQPLCRRPERRRLGPAAVDAGRVFDLSAAGF